MSTPFKERIIIAVGGSLLVPDAIDTHFIKDLRDIASNLINQGYQVILVPGGGKIARNYQEALKELQHDDPESLDWVGVKAIHLNADFLYRVFTGFDVHSIIHEPEELEGVDSSLVIKAAFKPGNSSDMGAVRMAEISGAKRIINFSNTSHVYSADPRIHADAKKFETLSWSEYRDLIPTEWVPGMSAPFDPIASQLAEESGITVAVLGASVENLQNYLDGNEFQGTILS
ncbi:MAG: uridylate kinase [Candidatus Paceibacteria bacterium]|jgi:uridylate kinase